MMNTAEYRQLGLKCGIEIHQQLEGKKLFCDCPTRIVDDDKYDIEIKRNLRAVIGETGKIDEAASHEMTKKKYFIYRAEKNTSCLVELDEEPPHTMNKDALDAALQVSLMLEGRVVDEVQIMRKTVVDGSNTSGFQRTSLVAQNGFIETSEGKVRISSICIEEDAAKIVEKTGTHDTYNLSRLGIPLVEIATEPDIVSPEHCKETAEKIGMILRSTGKAKRGLGTIRQDVNVSIKGGARVEIKGAQDLRMIPTLVEYEVLRQKNLLDLDITIPKNRRAKIVTELFSDTKCKFMSSAIKKKSTVLGFKLENLKGILGRELCPGKRVGSELSDFAKVRTGIGGIIHSDEKLEKYNFSDKEIESTKKFLDIGKNDCFVLIVAEEEIAKRAFDAVFERLESISAGVSKQVRKANPDGTTSYQRPMPGAARMYPETDTLPIKTDVSKVTLPELISDKKDRLVDSLSLGNDLAQLIAKSGKSELFESWVKKFPNIKPAFIGETFFSTPKNLKRKFKVDDTILKNSDFEMLFSKLNSGDITKDSVDSILLEICKGSEIDWNKYSQLSDKEVELEIKKIMKENKNLKFNILIGKVMGTLKGRAEGKKVMEMLKKLSE